MGFGIGLSLQDNARSLDHAPPISRNKCPGADEGIGEEDDPLHVPASLGKLPTLPKAASSRCLVQDSGALCIHQQLRIQQALDQNFETGDGRFLRRHSNFSMASPVGQTWR